MVLRATGAAMAEMTSTIATTTTSSISVNPRAPFARLRVLWRCRPGLLTVSLISLQNIALLPGPLPVILPIYPVNGVTVTITKDSAGRMNKRPPARWFSITGVCAIAVPFFRIFQVLQINGLEMVSAR
jgi:hypothetical protein